MDVLRAIQSRALYRGGPLLACLCAEPEELDKKRHLIPEWHVKGNAALGVMQTHLSRHDWFAGGRYSIADIALYGYTTAPRTAASTFRLPGRRRWLSRVAGEPGHVPLSERWRVEPCQNRGLIYGRDVEAARAGEVSYAPSDVPGGNGALE